MDDTFGRRVDAKWLSLALLATLAAVSVIAALFGANVHHFQSQTVAGGTDGAFSVTANGSASYVITLKVPPGTSNAQPALKLVYDSHQGPGQAGVGWSLDGLKTISRCPAIPAIDGYAGAINYDANDRYCLSGKRLISVSDDGKEFRTVIDQFSRMTATYGRCGAGPCSFTVRARDGSVLEFGTTTDSAIPAADRSDLAIETWALAKVTDANGNTISYRYDTSELSATGAYYISNISYTGNARANPTFLASRAIQFSYRPADTYLVQYRAGSAHSPRKILSTIAFTVGGATVRTYDFGYALGATTRRERLASIAECGATGVCFRPTRFRYADEGSSNGIFSAGASMSLGVPMSKGAHYLFGDFTGHGLQDVVRIYRSGDTALAQLFERTPSGFLPASQPVTIGPWHDDAQYLSGDFSGGGLSDIAELAHSGGSLVLHGLVATGKGFVTAPWRTDLGPAHGHETFLTGDFDGTGRIDLCAIYQSGNKVAVTSYMATGTDFVPTAWQGLDVEWHGGFFLPGAFTSSGRTNLAYVHKSGEGVAIQLIQYQSGKASASIWYTSQSQSWREGAKFLAGDFNGDGLADIVRTYASGEAAHIDAFLSSDRGFVASDLGSVATPLRAADQLYSADLNGDGLTDILVLRQSGEQIAASAILVRPGESGAHADAVGWAIDHPGVWAGSDLHAGDMTGLGFGDVLRFFASGDALTAQIYALSPYRLPGGEVALGPDLLKSVTTGTAAATSIRYAPLTNAVDKIYTKSSGALFPARDVQSSYAVVSGYDISDGRGAVYKHALSYAGARIDTINWGWLGFSDIRDQDLQTHLVAHRIYSQGFPVIGTENELRNELATGQIISRTSSFYDCVTSSKTTAGLAGQCQRRSDKPQAFFANVFQVGLTRYDDEVNEPGQPPPDQEQTVRISRDEFGNIVSFAEEAKAGGQSDRLFVCSSYRNDTQPTWHLGLLTEVKVTLGANPCAAMDRWDASVDQRWSAFSYDDNGNMLVSSQWLASAGPSHRLNGCPLGTGGGYWVCSRFAYDIYGNAISHTDANGNVYHASYDGAYHTFPEILRAPPTAGGAELSVRYEYDPGFGTTSRFTDANGNIFSRTLDALGREIQFSGPAPATGSQVPLSTTSYDTADNGAGVLETVASCTTWQQCGSGSQASWYRQGVAKDGLGRNYRWSEGFPEGALGACGGNTAAIVRDLTFDGLGQVATMSLPYYAGATAIPRYAFSYDDRQRPRLVVSPDGIATELGYDLKAWSNTRKVHRADGVSMIQTTTTMLDPHKRPVRVTAPDGGETGYRYSPLGEVVSKVDPIGSTTTFERDTLGRVIAIATTDRGTQRLAYDDAGNVVSETDAKGQEIKYHYDALNRVTERVSYGADGTRYRSIVYSYDGDASHPNQKGFLTKLTDGAQNQSFAYDPYGDRTMMTTAIPGFTKAFTFNWSYSPRLQPVQFIYPDESLLENAYTGPGALCSVDLTRKDGSKKNFATYSDFTALRQPQTSHWGDGTTTKATFDAVGRDLTLTAGVPGSPPLLDYSYQWARDPVEPAGVLTAQIDRAAPKQSQTFGYDVADRLISAVGAYGSTSYGYNKGGALTRINDAAYTYMAPNSYRIKSIGNPNATGPRSDFLFDANGDLASEIVQSSGALRNATLFLQFDPERNLQSLFDGQQKLAMSYGASQERLSKTDADGVQTWYIGPDYTVSVLKDGRLVATKSIRGDDNATIAETSDEPAGIAFSARQPRQR